jgi:hypothetical protein
MPQLLMMASWVMVTQAWSVLFVAVKGTTQLSNLCGGKETLLVLLKLLFVIMAHLLLLLVSQIGKAVFKIWRICASNN